MDGTDRFDWKSVARMLVLVLVAACFSAACDDGGGGGSPDGGGCTQALCTSGSAACCASEDPGTWNPAAWACDCGSPPADGDADVPGDTPDDVASGEVGVPLHIFFDLRGMRIYGRFAGGTEMKMPRYILTEIAGDPHWGDPGERVFDFDCSPGTGTEAEPNGLGETPEDGQTLPFELSGVTCPPTVGDQLLLDEDTVDLGTLSAGAAIDVEVTAGAGDPTYPFFQIVRLNSAGTSIEWASYGPSDMSSSPARRQFVIDTRGHYYLAVVDGRAQSSAYYGAGTVPVADQCCEGGPAYTYDLSIDSFAPAATDGALTVGSTTSGQLDGGDLDIYSLAVTSGTTYDIRMRADDGSLLDPYLVIYDPATSAVLGFNDDEDYAGGNRNAYVAYRAASSGTVLVVAAYWGAWFRGGAPGYTVIAE